MVTPTASVADNNTVGWRFDNTYSRLPDVLFAPAKPATVRAPRVSILNHRLADELGLDLGAMSPEAAAALFAGQDLPAGSRPIAQAYAGHQFGGFTMLGDGRAILLGEHRTPSGRLVDIQLKGAGRTRFSRGGDGLAALGPMLREYVISEAMAALGIPTTRSLAVVTTGEPVYRASALRGAILTRVAASHIRVGTFEYLAARRDESNLRVLADYAIDRHYPELADAPRKYLEFFRAVTDRQASLIARWQLVGFIHGVMNTDNMAISGETIDYGPCAFMNAYRPGHGVQLDRPRRPLRLRQSTRDRAVEPGPLRRDPVAAPGSRPGEGGRHRHGGSRRISRPVRAVLARRDAEEAGAPDGRGRRRRVDPVAARLDAEIPGRFHQHVPRPVVGGAAGRRPVSGPGLPGLVLTMAASTQS